MSFFLGTTCLFTPTSSQAMLVDDEDLSALYASRSEFIKYKEKKTIVSHRLSDKENYTAGDYGGLRRRFFTPQDGDNVFSALGLTRQGVARELLQNAYALQVRLDWQPAIYEFFKNNFSAEQAVRQEIGRVRRALNSHDPIKGEIGVEENLETIVSKLHQALTCTPSSNIAKIEATYLPLPDPLRQAFAEYKSLLLALSDNERESASVWTSFENSRLGYREDIYTAYVNHCIAKQDYPITSLRSEIAPMTHFLTALCSFYKKPLIIWQYDKHKQLTLSNPYRVVASSVHGNNTWEVVQDGKYFTRVVPIDNSVAIEQALTKENEDLEKIQKVHSLDSISKRLETLSALPPESRIFYYKAYLETYICKAQKVYKTIQNKPFPPTDQQKQLAEKFKSMQVHVQKQEEAIKKYEENLPALKEEFSSLAHALQRYDDVYRQDLTSVNREPDDIGVISALFELSRYYNNRFEQAPKHSPEAQTNRQYADLFDDMCQAKLKVFLESLPQQIKTQQKKATQRFQDLKAKNLRLEDLHANFPYSYSYNDDYAVAQQIFRKVLLGQQPNEKCINPSYLYANPFFDRTCNDVNKVYSDVSDDQLKEQLYSLYKSIFYILTSKEDYEFLSANIKNIVTLDLDGSTDFAPQVFIGNKSLTFLLDKRYEEERARGNTMVFIPDLYEPILRETLESNEEGIIWSFKERRINFIKTNDINQKWDNKVLKLKLLESFFYLPSVFNRLLFSVPVGRSEDPLMTTKKLQRKRFAHLHDNNARYVHETDAISQGHLNNCTTAQTLAQLFGRCIDGIREGLDYFETGSFTSPKSTAAEIAKVHELYVSDFCQKYKNLSDDNEWRTIVPQFVKARTFLSLMHTGDPLDKFFSFNYNILKQDADGILSVKDIMDKFLKGGWVQKTYPQSNGPDIVKRVTFEPFNAEKAIDLAYAAYEKGRQKNPEGQVLTHDSIVDLITSDPYLNHLYSAASEILETPEATLDTPFFEVKDQHNQLAGTYKGIYCKRAFFECILTKLGYIIDPNPETAWKKEEKEFLAKHKKKQEEELAELMAVGLKILDTEPLIEKLILALGEAEASHAKISQENLQTFKECLESKNFDLKNTIHDLLQVFYDQSEGKSEYWAQIEETIPEITKRLVARNVSGADEDFTGSAGAEPLFQRLISEISYAEQDEGSIISRATLQECQHCLEGQDLVLKADILAMLKEAYAAYTPKLPYWDQVRKDCPELMAYIDPAENQQIKKTNKQENSIRISEEDKIIDNLLNNLEKAKYYEFSFSARTLEDCRKCLNSQNTLLRSIFLRPLQEAYSDNPNLPCWQQLQREIPAIIQLLARTSSAQM